MVTYYTDPLCCWSWALEPHWNRLKSDYQQLIKWRYVMGGMIQDWTTYNDPMNAISRPIQFGPIWMHASQVSGTPIDYSIWHKDPPASSFPSCIAVKCASLQSPRAAELLLHDLRKAVMVEGRNISREPVIMEAAEALNKRSPNIFDYDKFICSWKDGSGIEAFSGDLRQTRFLKIGRYPTITFTAGGPTGVMITGYRPYLILEESLKKMLGELP